MVQKFLLLWGDPSIPHFCRYQLLEVFNYYSQRYKFPKICKIMIFCAKCRSQGNVWTGTLKGDFFLLKSRGFRINLRGATQR